MFLPYWLFYKFWTSWELMLGVSYLIIYHVIQLLLILCLSKTPHWLLKEARSLFFFYFFFFHLKKKIHNHVFIVSSFEYLISTSLYAARVYLLFEKKKNYLQYQYAPLVTLFSLFSQYNKVFFLPLTIAG